MLTLITVPPTRGAICVMCPSTCASSVDSLPRERSQKMPAITIKTSRTAPPMRKRPPLPPVFSTFSAFSPAFSSAITALLRYNS